MTLHNVIFLRYSKESFFIPIISTGVVLVEKTSFFIGVVISDGNMLNLNFPIFYK